MKRFALACTLFTLLAACGPTPTPSHYHFRVGQNFTGAFHQITTGQHDIQSLGSEFTAKESFHVVSIDASGKATINVEISAFTASSDTTVQIATPPPFQFVIDPLGEISSGHVWPILGALQSLPAADQLCVPLPTAPLSNSLTWLAPVGHSRSETFTARVDSFQEGYAVPLSATTQVKLSTSSQNNGITYTSVGTVSQSLICKFDPTNSRPIDLRGAIDFQFTQTANFGSSSQITTSTGRIVTTLAYTF